MNKQMINNNWGFYEILLEVKKAFILNIKKRVWIHKWRVTHGHGNVQQIKHANEPTQTPASFTLVSYWALLELSDNGQHFFFFRFRATARPVPARGCLRRPSWPTAESSTPFGTPQVRQISE